MYFLQDLKFFNTPKPQLYNFYILFSLKLVFSQVNVIRYSFKHVLITIPLSGYIPIYGCNTLVIWTLTWLPFLIYDQQCGNE